MTGLVRAELVKLVSTRVWLFLLLGAVALTALSVSLTVGFAENPQSQLPGRADPRLQPIALSSVTAGTVFVLVLSIIGITQEYRHRTATPTFLTTPRRGRVLLAKLVVYVLAGAAFAVAGAVTAVAISLPWLWASGADVSMTGDNLDVLLGGALGVTLYAGLGVGVGALVRNQVGAIVGVLVYSFVLEQIVRGVPATAPYYRWLPGGGLEAMSASFMGPDLLERWQGALLLIGYGLLSAALAAGVTLRRDVL